MTEQFVAALEFVSRMTYRYGSYMSFHDGLNRCLVNYVELRRKVITN